MARNESLAKRLADISAEVRQQSAALREAEMALNTIRKIVAATDAAMVAHPETREVTARISAVLKTVGC